MDTVQRVGQAKRELSQQVARFFSAVSFEPGAAPSYDLLHDLFVPHGLLINTTGPSAEICSVDQFIGIRMGTFRSGKVTRYRVEEISETTEVFGHVAHRATGFVRTGERSGVPFSTRGMIFFQFVRLPAGWFISAATWDDQRPGQMLSGHAEPTEFG